MPLPKHSLKRGPLPNNKLLLDVAPEKTATLPNHKRQKATSDKKPQASKKHNLINHAKAPHNTKKASPKGCLPLLKTTL